MENRSSVDIGAVDSEIIFHKYCIANKNRNRVTNINSRVNQKKTLNPKKVMIFIPRRHSVRKMPLKFHYINNALMYLNIYVM